jgi:hypothetical protein
MSTYTIGISVFLLCVALILGFFFDSYESFIGSPDAKRCGLNEPPCRANQACVNSWCVESTPPPIPRTTGLPVLP